MHANRKLARKLAARGIPISACRQNKSPSTQNGFKDARPDASHWDRNPDDLVAVPTGDFFVYDLDQPLKQSIAALEAATGLTWAQIEAQCSLIVETPSGGLHLYFARWPGVSARTSAGKIGPGIDVRGHDADGNPTGYVIAPDSKLADGRSYKIIKGEF